MNAAFFCLECEQNHMVISSVSSSPGTNGSMRVITLLCTFTRPLPLQTGHFADKGAPPGPGKRYVPCLHNACRP